MLPENKAVLHEALEVLKRYTPEHEPCILFYPNNVDAEIVANPEGAVAAYMQLISDLHDAQPTLFVSDLQTVFVRYNDVEREEFRIAVYAEEKEQILQRNSQPASPAKEPFLNTLGCFLAAATLIVIFLAGIWSLGGALLGLIW
jgi:hypothetical protein